MEVPLALLGLLLLLPAPVSGQLVRSFDANAAGTTSFLVTDPSTGATLCEGHAVFALEAAEGAGAVAWEAPGCEGAHAPGAGYFAFWCTDACFNDCWFHRDWPAWEAYAVSCERTYFVGDAWWTIQLTLARDGTFGFHRYAPEGNAEAHGTLLVTSWPA